MNFTTHYHSPLGDITLASNGTALIGLWIDGQKHFSSTLVQQYEAKNKLPVFDETFRWLDIYFSCHKPDFTPSFLLQGTVFQKRVWTALTAIPYGQTLSYGELAHRLGCHSAQAVGGAVGRNPISIIVPCHRVVGSDGSLTGYAAGLDRKRALLQLENHFAFLETV